MSDFQGRWNIEKSQKVQDVRPTVPGTRLIRGSLGWCVKNVTNKCFNQNFARKFTIKSVKLGVNWIYLNQLQCNLQLIALNSHFSSTWLFWFKFIYILYKESLSAIIKKSTYISNQKMCCCLKIAVRVEIRHFSVQMSSARKIGEL